MHILVIYSEHFCYSNDMNKSVNITNIDPLYQKPNGVYVQEIDRIDLPLGFEPVVRHLVTIPKGAVSANHKHPRKEAFIGIGDDLEFTWLDETNHVQTFQMNLDGKLHLIVVDSHVAHAIKNNSQSPAVLLEYADRTQKESDVVGVRLV
jgi:uncharacterized RmlC-like cupin family protein